MKGPSVCGVCSYFRSEHLNLPSATLGQVQCIYKKSQNDDVLLSVTWYFGNNETI